MKGKRKIRSRIVHNFEQTIDLNLENDHLTEIHLIKIVIFQLIEIFNNPPASEASERSELA